MSLHTCVMMCVVWCGCDLHLKVTCEASRARIKMVHNTGISAQLFIVTNHYLFITTGKPNTIVHAMKQRRKRGLLALIRGDMFVLTCVWVFVRPLKYK